MNELAVLLVIALLLDATIGEPEWIWSRVPHPAVIMGKAVAILDRRLNHGDHRILKGAVVVVLLVIGAAALGVILGLFGNVVEVLAAAILLAQKSLVAHVRAVSDGLRRSLGDGRRSVAMIVSRDVTEMDSAAVSRAAIESAAENLGDGVIAPAFWFLMAGLPGLIIYKVVNTADSMIGYRTPQYEKFGKVAARLDDVLNWLPARLTALLIAVTGGVLGQWRAIAADARRHRSPNAGWPEAAMARAIHVALAGPRSYDGVAQPFPWVFGAGARDIGAVEINLAITRLWQAWSLMLGITIILALL